MRWAQALDAAFEPRVVAVVGVSAEVQQQRPTFGSGNSFIINYQSMNYGGRLYAVNPKASGPILGVPVYPSIKAVPEPVDLAIVAVPAPAAPAVLEECAAAGVKAVHMYTAGFEETEIGRAHV
jgi:acetyltransferase